MRRRRQLPQIRWSWPSDNINWLRSTSAAEHRTSTPYRPNGDGSACCAPCRTSLYGEASLDGVRLRIVVRSIRYQGRIFPLEAAAYDLDGQPGLNIPDSRERRAVKEALADIGQQTGTSIDISRNAGQQVLADISRTALRATTRYAAEKLKEV